MLARRLAFLLMSVGLYVGLPSGPCGTWGVAPACAQPTDSGRQLVAVIHIDLVGDEQPGLVDQLDGGLIEAIEAAGFTAAPYVEIEAKLAGEPSLADCIAADCLSALPARLGTNHFVRLRVEVSETIYDYELLLLTAEGDSGGIKERGTGSCPVCTADELVAEVKGTAETLLAVFRPLPIELITEPSGAQLEIDGRVVGTGPITAALAPGFHQVRAQLDGYLPAEERIEVLPDAGEPQRFTFSLVTAPGGDDGGGGSSLGVLKWPLAGASVAALATGAAYLLIDGDITCSSGPVEECATIYDTATLGYAALGAGVVLGAAAGYLFWRDAGTDEAPTAEARGLVPALLPARGGAIGAVHLRF
ncbi:PEGA domain-containing protein [Haliangium sp.]|uniref:PEGA domain-containing protein n=1 Tax=Haliangium sp. TaxID=2663208 RepID=UPI003D141AF3